MVDLCKLFPSISIGLRNPLIQCFLQIRSNHTEHRWEPAELNGGKFCEVVYTIVAGSISGSLPTKPSKPKNMIDACRSLESIPPDPNRIGDRSLRILIPRMLVSLYEVRNNRGVGHIGGDVDPNYLDSTVVLGMVNWILAELIRVFHGISTKEAQETVDALVERKHPLVWEVAGIKRVLDPSMDKKKQVLLLLYSEPSWVSETDLRTWIEYSNASMFRKQILESFHKTRLIEYDTQNRKLKISPLGITKVEESILAYYE